LRQRRHAFPRRSGLVQLAAAKPADGAFICLASTGFPMRVFLASALLIASLLIGQQWITRASLAQGLPAAPTVTLR
jgi:hypothetical protein